MDNKTIVDLVVDQALGIITKSSPFGAIPVVNSLVKSVASTSIRIALEKTFLKDYITNIEKELEKQNKLATDLRDKINTAKTAEEKKNAQDQLKEAYRKLFTF